MPATYRIPVQALQQQARMPRTQFTLFALFTLFGLFLIISLLINTFDEPRNMPATTTSAAPARKIVGTRCKFDVTDDGRQYGLIEVTGVAANSVQYRMTNPLRGR